MGNRYNVLVAKEVLSGGGTLLAPSTRRFAISITVQDCARSQKTCLKSMPRKTYSLTLSRNSQSIMVTGFVSTQDVQEVLHRRTLLVPVSSVIDLASANAANMGVPNKLMSNMIGKAVISSKEGDVEEKLSYYYRTDILHTLPCCQRESLVERGATLARAQGGLLNERPRDLFLSCFDI